MASRTATKLVHPPREELEFTRVMAALSDPVRLAIVARLADAGSDVPLGNIAVFDFEGAPGALTAQVGYWSLPAGRGRGAMTTALREVCAHVRRPTAEGGLGVRRLYLLTDVENSASRRLAERAGFEQVGIERAESPRADGTFGDSALYDLV